MMFIVFPDGYVSPTIEKLPVLKVPSDAKKTFNLVEFVLHQWGSESDFKRDLDEGILPGAIIVEASLGQIEILCNPDNMPEYITKNIRVLNVAEMGSMLASAAFGAPRIDESEVYDMYTSGQFSSQSESSFEDKLTRLRDDIETESDGVEDPESTDSELDRE